MVPAENTNRSEVLMETVVMPKELTADNGAKAALIGEFHVMLPVACDVCNGTGEDIDGYGECPECHGGGGFVRTFNVPWTVIKEIYAKAVEHFSQPGAEAGADKFCKCHPPIHIHEGTHCRRCGRKIPHRLT
jgi:hypothetical protein